MSRNSREINVKFDPSGFYIKIRNRRKIWWKKRSSYYFPLLFLRILGVLVSERSEERISFTMIMAFFLCLRTRFRPE